MNQPPLNPDAVREAVLSVSDLFQIDTENAAVITREAIRAYFAVAQPEVNSVEELDALPPDSYVQGWDGFKHAKTHGGDWVLCVEHTRGSHAGASIELPARVLYRPAVNA